MYIFKEETFMKMTPVYALMCRTIKVMDDHFELEDIYSTREKADDALMRIEREALDAGLKCEWICVAKDGWKQLRVLSTYKGRVVMHKVFYIEVRPLDGPMKEDYNRFKD
jgi:hypothetical protein